MSLRVWLPLNGDINNQGLENIEFSNTATSYITVDNNGKIGKCYNFNSSSINSGIFSNDNGFMSKYINNKSWSICVWINTTSSDTCVISLSYGLRMFAGNSTHTYITLYNSSRTVNCISSIASNDGKWHHLCATYDVNTNNIKFYVDGTNTGNANYTSGYTYASSWTNGIFIGRDPNNSTVNNHYLYKGKMNDVRIYDHCLSAKEVKELSKGLVCHYPLNNNAGQENLFNWGNKGNKIITLNDYRNTGSFTQFSGCLTFDAKDTVGTTYTISFWAKSPNGTTSLLLYNNNSTPRYFYFSPTTLTTSLNNEWQYFTYTFINQDRGSGTTTASTYNRIEIYMPSQMGGQVKLIKIEEGEKATSWSPAPSDAYYNKLGYDKNIIYDTSGYGYNGIKNGNGDIIISTNTARNSLSSFFGEHNTPRMDMLDSSLFPALTSCTISWWEYSTVSSNTLIFTGIAAGGSKYIAAGSPTNRLYDSNIGTSGITMYKDGVVVSTTYSGTNVYHNNCFRTQNEWHHYCMTGVNLSSWDKFYINYYSSSFPTQAYLSDVRIYSTVLSEDDVKELYQVGASIDKNGNVFAYEFKED